MSVSVSEHFYQKMKKYGLSPTEIFRRGMVTYLYEFNELGFKGNQKAQEWYYIYKAFQKIIEEEAKTRKMLSALFSFFVEKIFEDLKGGIMKDGKKDRSTVATQRQKGPDLPGGRNRSGVHKTESEHPQKHNEGKTEEERTRLEHSPEGRKAENKEQPSVK